MFLTPLNRRNNLFDSLFEDFLSVPLGVQTHSTDKDVALTVDVPGLTKDDITIDIDKGILTISGQAELETGMRSVNRSFSVPQEIDVESVKANVQNGILSIVLPKLPSAQRKTILIE